MRQFDRIRAGKAPFGEKYMCARLWGALLLIAFFVGLMSGQVAAQEKDKSKEKSKSSKPSSGQQPRPNTPPGQRQNTPGDPYHRPGQPSEPNRNPNAERKAGPDNRQSADKDLKTTPNNEKNNNSQGVEAKPKTDTTKPAGDSNTKTPPTAENKSKPDPGNGTATAKPDDTKARSTTDTGKPQTERTKPQPGGNKQIPDTTRQSVSAKPPRPTLTEVKKPNGEIEKVAPSGAVRERTKVDQKSGTERTQQLTPTGRVDREIVKKQDGSVQTTQFASNGKVAREEVLHKDGSKAVTTQQTGRDGKPRVQETVQTDTSGKAVSKTVVVNNTTIINNTTVNKTVVKNYNVGHYGYVYRPAYVVSSPVYVSWYDPYWYGPAGVVVVHPFHYHWGWEHYGWYHHYHGPYFVTYDIYPTPAYWMTDWMVAGYMADHYEASMSAAQAREDARAAREEAENSRQAAEKAKDQAEIAEAKAAAAQAELRAKNAEERAERAQRAESNVGKTNPNATPIDKQTKEALKTQIEQTIAEKKEFAAESEKTGQQVIPDVSRALKDPHHIYPVSKVTSVISAKDSSPAGILSEGDLLKLEPGQDETLKNADQNTFVTMRVMTSKGEENEVTAGTLVSIPLKDLQEFDNEFRAKLDMGLAEADKNKDLFKQGQTAQPN